jgi:toluene monooxygenase system protein D
MTRQERVGPVLEASEIGRAIVTAIRAHEDDVEVQDRGAYLRVLVPQRCRVTREAIERALGRSFRMPMDLERAMPSFKGRFHVNQEEATWELTRR